MMTPTMRPSDKTKICAGAVLLALTTATVAAHADEARTADVAANDERMAEARRQFEAGVSLLDDPDGAKYEEAHHAFKKAYELSRSPKVLGNIGFCAMHLERDGEAIDAYSAYLREVPEIEDRERAQIQRDLVTLTSTVGRLRVVVKSTGNAFSLLDRRTQTRGDAIENAYAFEGTETTIRLRSGRHTFKVKGPEGESIPFDVTVEPGSMVSHDFTFAPPTQPRPDSSSASVVGKSPSLAGPVILGVAGLAAIGTGVVTGLMARSKTSEIERNCPSDLCPSTYDLASERSSAKTFGTVADVSLIGGGVLLAGAAIWYVLLPKGDSPKTSGKAPTWISSAMCTRDGCGLHLQRGF
ncbi:tetratricopeptide repeat protein [Labilithrix luteola]|nr:hypothetical protein [Labilithrix luteola]